MSKLRNFNPPHHDLLSHLKRRYSTLSLDLLYYTSLLVQVFKLSGSITDSLCELLSHYDRCPWQIALETNDWRASGVTGR